MLDWNESNRPLKAVVRRLVAESVKPGKTSAIMFPAGKALDVKALKDSGVLSTRTKLTAIEFDPTIARQMWVSLFRLGMARSTKVHNGEAHKLVIDKPIDLFFADFCGPGTNEEMEWIANAVPFITGKDSDVLITLKSNHRGHGFFAGIKPTDPAWRDDYRAERRLVSETPTTKVNTDGTLFNKESSDPTLKSLAVQRAVFRRIFAGFTFDLRSTVYRDQDMNSKNVAGSREMILHHITNFRKLSDRPLNWH